MIKMTTVKIIQIPIAKEMHKQSSENTMKRLKEREEVLKNSWEIEIPKLIEAIISNIKKATLKGYNSLYFNIADNAFNEHSLDNRIDYYFNGSYTGEMSYKIKEIFSQAGYRTKGYAVDGNAWNAYRSG